MKLRSLLLLSVALVSATVFVGFQAAPKKPRVLVITGHDVPSHDWRATTVSTRAQLEEGGQLEVVVSEEPAVLETQALARYDVIVLNYRHPPTEKLSEAARANLLSFVRGGKGLVALHFAVSSFSDWPEFQKLVGRTWVGKKEAPEGKASGHADRGPFRARVVSAKHPITEGLADFDADDELYSRLAGDTPIEVLVTAESTFSKQTEPLAWTLPQGQGRVFVTVLGHDVRARENPAFKALLTRGCAWAAGKGK